MAMSSNAAFSVVAILLTLFLRYVLLRANKRLESGQSTVAEEMKGQSQKAISGLTDEERAAYQEEFRYVA